MGDDELFQALGFTWDRAQVPRNVPVHSVKRAVFRMHKSLSEYVWDASMLEGNPFTFPEVQTLLDGITVGGRKLSDERQVLNLAESAKELLILVREGKFAFTKQTSDHLHSLIARDEAFDAGHFRGEGEEKTLTPGVALGEYGKHTPPATEPGGANLRRLHVLGLSAITERIESTYEQALAYFLFGALQQFYFDGNKRTARYMMNGHLMSQGIDAISIPAAWGKEFNAKMVDFYRTKDATEMIEFLTKCHPEIGAKDADSLTLDE